MNSNDWKLDLACLAERYSETGVLHDLPNMSELEQFQTLTWLRRYEEGRSCAS